MRPIRLALLLLISFLFVLPVQAGKKPPKAVPPATKVKAPKEVTVYVTRTGAKYHTSGCRYLRSSSIPMGLKEAKKSYTACSVCNPPE